LSGNSDTKLSDRCHLSHEMSIKISNSMLLSEKKCAELKVKFVKSTYVTKHLLSFDMESWIECFCAMICFFHLFRDVSENKKL